ncbi:Cleavage and polyadenylation specificity factor subunit 1 [Sarcoptes scabiei]|uniref:Cleavage and polyadenylation specificity factor subunit 1 n=1 Tax=Sarcoptes scabiei TaxID=52283 RepID=A0A834R994_SARSC|nr:Cleavage and polyadenylation specificity factor subunit 1 [Sarcoptes scabiei]
MYAICKVVHPSNQVEHSIYCNFYNYNEKNLITAGLNQLKVYRLIRINEDVDRVGKDKIDDIDDDTKSDTFDQDDLFDIDVKNHFKNVDNVKLVCLQTFQLNANIEALNSVSFFGYNRDCMLLAFNDAKLSIVEYDPSTHDLRTISMHYFEDDDMRPGFTSFIQPPIIRVDPENRCAVLLIYNKSIVVIPFRQNIVLDEDENAPFSNNPSNPNCTMVAKNLPVLPSYKLHLNNEQYGVNLNNIIDLQFLHNYNEPTLLILYEPVPTWSGRIAVRQDTVSMMTISLDVHQRVHPHIWSLTNLPYNAFAALPIPKPIGGVLIFASNSLIHLNQGLPPFGVSLNGFNDSNTSFPLKTQDDVIISLDCCRAAFIDNKKILLTLKNGELFVLKLHNDMTRSVRTFKFIPIGSSVIALTISRCEDEYFFIGSRLGHSILIQYKEQSDYNESENFKSKTIDDRISIAELIKNGYIENGLTEDQFLYGEDYCNSQKKIRSENVENEEMDGYLDSNSLGPKTSNEMIENEQESKQEENEIDLIRRHRNNLLEIRHDSRNEKFSFLLRLCDVIYNISPCGSVCLGEPFIENMANHRDIDVEMITASGHMNTGAINILQQSIKPQIETSFKLPGCFDCWTVFGPNYHSEQDTSVHKYLIITQEDSTLVFQVGQEINELDQSGFVTQNSTIHVGNIGGNKYILQICAYSVRLLEETHELQQFPIDIDSPLIHASIADPYAVLMSEKSIILIRLKINITNGSACLVISKPDLSTAKSPIVALCIYKDCSGLFTTQTRASETFNMRKATVKKTKSHAAPSITSTLSAAVTIDEEDELLYGSSMASFLNNSNLNSSEINQTEEDEEENVAKQKNHKIPIVDKIEPTFWLFIVRENGVLEIYTLPEFKLVYLVKNFPLGLKVLVDSVQTTDHSFQNHSDISSSMEITKEILVCGMGFKQSKPYLFARLEEDFFIYEIYPYFESQVDGHLKIRFKKISMNYQFVRIPKSYTPQSDEFDGVRKTLMFRHNWLRIFDNVGGYSGVFLCGFFPCWFFMTTRGELRAHPMNSDGMISSFATFNNINCPNGYLYINSDEELRFSVLPDYYEIDSTWPSIHIPFKRTVHFVNYHLESKTYVIVSSRLIEITKLVRIGGEEKDYDPIEADSRYIYCKTEQFELQLLSPVNWSLIPGTLIELDEWEHVTSIKTVMLASEGTTSGLKGYIAIGTNFSYGEDVTNRGRIWILDIIEVVPEPGKPLTKNKIKIVYCEDQKGPVTAICQVQGYLLAAIGQKIYIWQLKESELVGIAFIDTQIYVHTAMAVRNLILIGDVFKSISLLRYQEETRTLSLVSRDQKSLQVYACEFMIDQNQLCFVVSDSNKNLIIYGYQPDNSESLGGTRLLRRADFHLGSCVNSFFRIRCRIPFKFIDDRLKQIYKKRHITMFATLDGSIGYLLPITEKTYRRLLMLQNLLTTNIQHIAGINPKAFRCIKHYQNELMNPSKNILDGDLLFKFLNLSLSEKMEIAKKIGTTIKQIYDDLQETHCITCHF